MMTTTARLTYNTTPTSRRCFAVSASAKRSGAVAPFRTGVPALLAGFIAAQINFVHPGPAVADVYEAQPSIDFVADSNVEDVISEVEDAEIPLLEAKMGRLSQTGSQEEVAATERELEAIEREAALLAEEETQGSVPSDEMVQQTGGLLDQINALKAVMRGIQQ